MNLSDGMKKKSKDQDLDQTNTSQVFCAKFSDETFHFYKKTSEINFNKLKPNYDY